MYHGTESLSNLEPRIWSLVPEKLKQLVDIHAFKKGIKKWKPENCSCGLCKTFLNVFEYKFRSTPPETYIYIYIHIYIYIYIYTDIYIYIHIYISGHK